MAPCFQLGLIGTGNLAVGYYMVIGPAHPIMDWVMSSEMHCSRENCSRNNKSGSGRFRRHRQLEWVIVSDSPDICSCSVHTYNLMQICLRLINWRVFQMSLHNMWTRNGLPHTVTQSGMSLKEKGKNSNQNCCPLWRGSQRHRSILIHG